MARSSDYARIELAILEEALTGATRAELGLAAQSADPRVMQAEIQRRVDALVRNRALAERDGMWVTTARGRRALTTARRKTVQERVDTAPEAGERKPPR